jgi:hypothetical protein
MGFMGNGQVRMYDGTYKYVKDLQKGDVVDGDPFGGFIIHCAVRILSGYRRELTLVRTLLVTHGQPIYVEDEWALSSTVPGATVVCDACDQVYNFVLDRGHVLMIEGIPCVTLGHGFEGPVMSHPYFGTDRVVNDLLRMPGWDDGVVLLNGTLRCPDTGLVCGLDQRPARDLANSP